MPATSKAQQMAMAIAEHNPSKLYSRNRGLLKMSRSQLHDFAATPRKGLPMKKEEGETPKDETRHSLKFLQKAMSMKKRKGGKNMVPLAQLRMAR